MATKNFTQFNTATPLTTSDYIVGYNAAGTAEIKTQVQSILNLKSDTAFATASATFLTIPVASSSYIQQDKIFLTQPLLKTFQKITSIDFPQTLASFTFLGVGDSMGWRKPTFAIMPYLWNRYGIGGAVFDGLVKRAFGNVTTTWAPNEANYTLWETGEVAFVGSGGSVEWGIQDGLPAGVNAGYVYSNQITVYSVASATGGTFKVQYSTDRSTWTDVTTLTSINTTDPTGPKALISTGTAPSLGYYTWRVLGLTGTSIIISAKILNTSDPGAVCGLIFRGGMTIASSNTVLSAIFNPIIANVAPDLVMWEQKDNPEDYVTGLPTYLNRWDSCFTAASAQPDWVLVGTNDTQANDTNTRQIRQTTKQVADSRKLAYYDFNEAIGGWDGIQRMRWDWDSTGTYDPVHLNDNAQRVGGQIFLRSAGLFTTPYKSDISQNVNDGGTLIYSLNSNSIGSTPLNVGFQINGTPGGQTSLRLGSRDGIGTWGMYKLSPTDGQVPYGFYIAGGLTNDARIMLDSDGRTAIRQTGVGETWPRTERLWVGESVPTYSTLTINHNNYGTDNQMTGKLLRATYKGNNVAGIDYRGNYQVLSAGGGLQIKEGNNARLGTTILTAGSAVVTNTSVTENTRIFLTSQSDGGTPGWLRVSTRSLSASFTVRSSSDTDTSTVAYMLVEAL
jgi:hypothetical protein